MDRLLQAILELRAGVSFAGRQFQLDVNEDEFFVDRLMFYVEQAGP